MASLETVDGFAIGVPVRLGKYTLLTRLATGGMGEVYVAQMSGAAGFEKRVVIKRILPQLAQDEHFVKMFLDEARITAQLNHPNICTVFELGEIAGEYYIAMEYLEGLALSKLMDKYSPGGLDLRIAAGLMAQACEGLAHAHEFSDPARQIDGIVHRDISPQNLFVTTAGLVKVLDFGVAKLHREGSKTVSNSAKGKYLYMSPEQVQGEPVDRRSDIFALGVVLFETLTGRHLFRRDTEFQTLQAIISGDRARVDDFRSDVPPAVSEVVERALSVNRSQRYASSRTLAEALTRAVAPLGGAASITELAEFVRREHSADITAQRERIRRASVQMQAVPPSDLPADLTETTPGRGRGRESSLRLAQPTPVPWSQSPAGRARAGSESGIRPARRASSVLDFVAPRRISSVEEAVQGEPGSGERHAGLFVAGDDAAARSSPEAGDLLLLQPRRYVRWGLLMGAGLAVALWIGHHFLYGTGRGASPQPVAVAAGAPLEPARTAEDEAAVPAPDPAAAPDQGAGGEGAAAGKAAGKADGRDDDGASDPALLAAPGTGNEAASGDTVAHAAGAPAGIRTRREPRVRDPRSRRGREVETSDTQAAPRNETGYLTIDATPYAEIFVNGERLGITPLVRIPLTAGQHTIRAVSKDGDTERLSVQIKPGETLSRRIRFSDARN